MKKILLAIAMAVAIMPLTFAQAPAASQPASGSAPVTKTKKHHKRSAKKAPKKSAAASTPTK